MLIRKTLAMAAATAGLIGAGMLTGASAASASVLPPEGSGGVVQFWNKHTGLCLEIADWRTDNGAPARQWYCTGGANQKWYETTNSAGRHTYVNVNSGKCLEIADWRTDNDAPARQWDCTGGANQSWSFTNSPEGLLQNYNSDRCLTIWDYGLGVNASQYDCNSGYTQETWHRE
ncbi:RICIN domain-containing protein [Streptomyces sp. NRRL F-5123]|uniref:RICIN domain-containing protein n=1 Tax=Streptomyces sp. NRRL F-5123 TaxID=1463856 RepID=UPI0006941F95|nr:RICIN domain-containing protein [Streptomyces sp. NRRL F-5123]